MDKLNILLDKEELSKININQKEAIDKGLIQKNNYNIYLQIQALYKKTFDYYIKELMSIDIDKKLDESNLDYGKLKQDQRHVFHKFSYLGSDYIFVRNFFYIERLTENELEKLKTKIKNEDYEIDDEIKTIVKNTFKQVIKKKDDIENLKVFYDWATPSFEFDNDSLVLYLNYGKNTIELSGIEFIHNKVKKEIYLDELLEKIKIELQEKMNCKIEVSKFKGVI